MCCIGIGPKTAYSILHEMIAKEACNTPLITISANEFDVQYEIEKDLEHEHKDCRICGLLADVCHTTKLEPKRMVLLSAALRMVAEAWDTEPEVLEEQKWMLDFNANFLLALLERPRAG